MDDETGDRGCFFIRQIPIHMPVQIADGDGAIDIDGAIGERTDRCLMGIVFVGDLADDFFQNVLERNEALDLAVLVDHERHLLLLLQELIELVAHARRVGDEPRLGRKAHDVELLDIPAVASECNQQILGVEHADDVLGLVFPDRHARILRLQNRVDDLTVGFVGVHGLHLGAMYHDVEHLKIGQVENAAEHMRIVFLHAAIALAKLDRATQLLMRFQDVGGIVLGRRCQPQQPPHDVLDGDCRWQ